MGALTDHHRRKLSSVSCSRLSEEGRLYENPIPDGAGKIAPHIVMLTAAVLIGGALGLAYQQLHETHPGVNKHRMKAEPVVLLTTGSGAVTGHSMMFQLKERGVLGAGLLWGGRGREEERNAILDPKSKEQLEELDGQTLIKDELVHVPEGVQHMAEQEVPGSNLLREEGGDLIERTYVHQPGEVVAEDEGGGKFVVDDKDRIVYVEEQGAEHVLRGLATKRRRSLRG